MTGGRENCWLNKLKIHVGEFCVVASPAFCHRKNHCPQGLAALCSRWRRLGRCRLAVKWALALQRLPICGQRSERTVIGNCDPGADENRNNQSAGKGVHDSFNHPCRWRAQIFSLGSMIGATEPEAMPSGVPISGIAVVDVDPMSGCSTRVAISIAVKSRAPARKKGAPGK